MNAQNRFRSPFRLLASLSLTVLFLSSCSDINKLEQEISEEEAAVREKMKPYTSSPSSYVHGIDVSHWQGTIDWKAVGHDNIAFSYIKVTEGDTFVDPEFQNNWTGTKENKIIHGAYHVFTPGDNGVAQAKHFLSTLSDIDQGYIGALPPALDIEQIQGDHLLRYAAEIKLWLVAVEHRLGCRPIIYTSPANWDAEFKNHFTGYRLWVADYDLEPTLPKGWDSWLFWQYTDKEPRSANESGTSAEAAQDAPEFGTLRKVRGIQGNTDLDIFQGTVSSLIRTTCSGGL